MEGNKLKQAQNKYWYQYKYDLSQVDIVMDL